MDRIQAMQCFVEAVRQRGLGAAAEVLGVSRSLVSRNIQGLEDMLGTRLMNRTTRSLSLTDAGRGYFSMCDDLLLRMREMDARIASEAVDARGELSVLAPRWLQDQATAMLVEFAAKWPEIRPRLTLGGMAQTAYGFLEQGCEVALHTRRIPDSRIVARALGEIRYCLCAAPDYLSRTPALDHPPDLAGHDALVQYNYHGWQFAREGKVERFQPEAAFSSNTFASLASAARCGLGVALLPEPLVRADLAEGALVEAMPDWRPAGQTLYLATAPGRAMPTKVRRLMEFAVDWFAANPL